MATKKEPTPKLRVSGFCNVTLPRTAAYDPHQRCPGCDCRATNCPCNPEEIRVTDEQQPASAEVENREPDQHPIVAALASLASATADVNAAMLGYGADWHDALFHLRDLRKATTVLGQLDASLVNYLYLHGEHGKMLVDDIGEVWITRGRSKERWEGETAVRDYVERCLAAVDGEYPDPEQVVAWVLEVVPVYPSTSLRVTPLRTAGLDPDDYRTSEPGNLSVTLPTGT